MNADTLLIPPKEKILPEEITLLYESVFPRVARFVQMRGGNLADAKDVFHDGLILFLPKTEANTFSLTADQGYLVGICQNIWRRKIRDNLKQQSNLSCYAKNRSHNNSINLDHLLSLVKTSGEKCLNLLRACFFSKGGMQEVADELGYSNAHSVSVQKFKCIAKLKLSVEQNKMHLDDFFE